MTESEPGSSSSWLPKVAIYGGGIFVMLMAQQAGAPFLPSAIAAGIATAGAIVWYDRRRSS